MYEATTADAMETAPSLMDDRAFVEELEQLEVRGVSRPLASPSSTPRDANANRWNERPPAGFACEAAAPQPRALLAQAWLPILVGFCLGAAASSALLHERVANIFGLLAR